VVLPIWQRRWDRDFTDRILRWRFLERPDWEAVIAYDGGRPVGFMDSFLRPYRTRAGVVRVREPADWYCHPDHRPVVSLKLIRNFMEKPEPILAVGGKAVTVGILPRLGYLKLPQVRSFVLPTGAGAMVKKLSKTFGFSLSSVPPRLAKPLSVTVGRHGGSGRGLPEVSVRPVREGEQIPELSPANGAYGLSPVLPRQEYAWFRSAPERVGEFTWLAFETADGRRGVSFSRLYNEGPFRAARVLHMDASEPSTPLYASILQETVRTLMRSEPQWIGARFNCAMACEALEAAGFKETASCTAYWWHRDLPPPEAPLHLSWTTGDEGLLPYPT
jgi:hypothetical protein